MIISFKRHSARRKLFDRRNSDNHSSKVAWKNTSVLYGHLRFSHEKDNNLSVTTSFFILNVINQHTKND